MGIERSVWFSLRDLIFEYDEDKNRKNIEKHGISFKTAARVFFDYDRIEMYDEEHSAEEDRYNTIGDASATESRDPIPMICCLWSIPSVNWLPKTADPPR